MRNNELKTMFWKNALESLPASIRSRYVQDIAAAERLELRIDAVVRSLSRAKAAVSRTFQTA
jgi:hypothetical protein